MTRTLPLAASLAVLLAVPAGCGGAAGPGARAAPTPAGAAQAPSTAPSASAPAPSDAAGTADGATYTIERVGSTTSQRCAPLDRVFCQTGDW